MRERKLPARCGCEEFFPISTKGKTPAYWLFQAFCSLDEAEQLRFVEMCAAADSSNQVREIAESAQRRRNTMERMVVCWGDVEEKLKRASRSGKKLKPDRDKQIFELHDQGLTPGQIAWDPEVTKLNGSRKMTAGAVTKVIKRGR